VRDNLINADYFDLDATALFAESWQADNGTLTRTALK